MGMGDSSGEGWAEASWGVAWPFACDGMGSSEEYEGGTCSAAPRRGVVSLASSVLSFVFLGSVDVDAIVWVLLRLSRTGMLQR